MNVFFSRAVFSLVSTSCNTLSISETDVDVYSNRIGKGNAGGTSTFGFGVGGLGGSSIFSTSSDFIL